MEEIHKVMVDFPNATF